jgi:parallel beta-helix repeat protein
VVKALTFVRAQHLLLPIILVLSFFLLVFLSLPTSANIVPHEPIVIAGDGDFTFANGVSSGSGKSDDPFVIEEYIIDVSTGIGVEISNTSQHFLLRNITIVGDSAKSSMGVRFDQVKWAHSENLSITRVDVGIALLKTAFCTIANNSISALSVGMDSALGVLNTISGNTIWVEGTGGSFESGIVLSGDVGTIINNTIIEGNCPTGVSIYSGKGQRLSNTSIQGFTDAGIIFIPLMIDWNLYEVGQVFINECTITNTSVGIDLFSCKSLVEGTTFRNISSFGIRGERSRNIQIVGNRFATVQSPISVKECGAPWIEKNMISGALSSGIAIESSSPLIRNNTINGSPYGILLRDVTESDISQNVIEDNGIGIMVENSYDLSISFCVILGSITQTGILAVDSEGLTIELNIINGSAKGIVFSSVNQTVVSKNLIAWCDDVAITVYSGSANYFYHNNLVWNNFDATSGTYYGPQTTDDALEDIWDDGGKGNYWSDFQIRYPDALVMGSVWDTPYGIAGTGGFEDRFPLANMLDLFPPVANAGPDQTVDQNTTVTLDGSTSSDDVNIVTFLWTFAYDNRSINLTGPIVTFIFDYPGSYFVMLKVTDGEERTSIDSVIIEVIDTQPPIANAGEDLHVAMEEDFTLDGSLSQDNVGLVSYIWTLDPGGQNVTFNQALVTFSFKVPGKYLAILIVSDSSGNWAIDTCEIHVMDVISPTADAGENIVVDQGTLVLLNGSSSTDNVAVVRWTWSFYYQSDHVLLFGEHASFEFLEPGLFKVTLEVSDDEGNLDSDGLVVHVRDTVPPTARAGRNLVIDQGLEVILDGRASTDNVGIIDYRWTFLNEGSSEEVRGAFVVVILQEAAEHLVTLNVTDDAGNWATDDVVVTVRDSTSPVADAGDDVTIAQGTNISFDGRGSRDNVMVVDYVWTFTINEMLITIHGKTPSFTFEEPGGYRVTLTVKDARGNCGIDNLHVTVQDTEPPVPLVVLDKEIFSSIPVIFDGTGSQDNTDVVLFSWTVIGPDSDEHLEGPIVPFTFNTSGNFIVHLEVADGAGNLASVSVEVEVIPLDVPWRLGPFKEAKGPAVDEAKVWVILNGTTYSAVSGEDGWIELMVNRFDLVSPAIVSARKDGYKPLDVILELDERGVPVDTIPPMVMETHYSTGNWYEAMVLVLIVVIIILGLFVWTSRRRES